MNNILMLKDILTGNDSSAFAFFSANVQHVLGISSVDEQVDLFEQAKNFADIQAYTDHIIPLTNFSIAEQWLTLAPGIITTFHFGHYRLLPLMLVLSDISLCVLVSQTVKEEQEAYYTTILGKERSTRVSFVTAEDPKLFFQIKSYLNKGYHILCYADGGKGLGKIQMQSHAMQVDFLHSRLWIRTGFAHMAYLADVPIYACWDRINNIDKKDFKPTIYRPLSKESRKYFVKECIHSLYTDFSHDVSSHPIAWENLLYLHHNIVPVPAETNVMLQTRYLPFKQDNYFFVLDRLTFLSYPINRTKFNFLWKILCK
jgi:hypothetical protein